MQRNTQHKPITKNQAKIVLTGNFNINSSIPFEVYRQAVKYDVTGHIKFQEHGKSEIVVEAENKTVEAFVHWLIIFVKKLGIHMNLNWSDSILNYNEFRIIHLKHEQLNA
ncbi:MAG: hypothetical protein B6D64_08240 [Bacteroidetes bacterium 4484_276]|nr:MAG: hypothetical protein B6D64_08240 [Bacteroidetes bacterium 4484_276]